MSDGKSHLAIKRKVVLFFALLLSFAMVLPTNILASTTNRLAGVDRFQTARVISEQFNQGAVQDVILATGINFPDALSVSVLATKLSAPILLVNTKAENSTEAFNYIVKHLSKSGTIHIIGGTGVINKGFEEKLNQLGFMNIDRIGGYDRYATDYQIAQKLAVGQNTPVVIASGEGFPDALSISSVASNKGWPILLVGKDYLSQNIEDYVSRHTLRKYILWEEQE